MPCSMTLRIVLKLCLKKYAETMSDIEEKSERLKKKLSAMLSELTGSEADMAGIP
mgnify:CR=1 FL=1